MPGMSFLSFLVVTIIAAAVAVVYHYLLKYRFLNSYDAFLGKVFIGWFGAWLGSPIFGNWLWKVEDVYVVPGILGAIAVIHLEVLLWKAIANLAVMRPVTVPAAKEELSPRKMPTAA